MKNIITKIFTLFLLPLAIAISFYFWSLPRITADYNFNSDELIYLSRSVYWTAFSSLDFRNPIWNDWGGYDQPQLTNYVYALVPGDRSLLEPHNSPCGSKNQDFFNSWSCLDGKPLGSWPSNTYSIKQMVISARTLGTGISALSLVTLYYLGYVVGGPLTGLFAAILLGWLSFFKNLGTMAMMDQILLIFLNIQLISAIKLAGSKKNLWTWLFILGLSTGLSWSTKFSAIIPTGLIFTYLTFSTLKNRHVKIIQLLASALFSGVIFLSLHPPFWSNPLGQFIKMITWRQTQIRAEQQMVYVPQNITDKFNYSFNEVFSSWKSQVEPKVSVTLLAIFIASLIALLKINPFFSLISLVNILVFILILPLKWNRYLLPIMPSVAVTIGYLPTLFAILSQKLWRLFIKNKQFFTGALIALAILTPYLIFPLYWLSIFILMITVLLTIQGYIVTRAMLYSFSDRPIKNILERLPTKSFSLIVPAKDESAVIGHTIQTLASLNYDQDLYEVLVIVRADDETTINAANLSIKNSHANHHIRVVKIDGDAYSKAYSLNIGISKAKHQIIGIFDAEDEPNQNILKRINDYLLTHPQTLVVQAPVHLTNVKDSWYASLNAIEYYYWFRSVLPYLSTKGITPLGGNTIFTDKSVYAQVGTYDEQCLTEDAELGIRLAKHGIKVGVISDPTIATKEEVPHNEFEVIRQRSRWDQGYFQVIEKSNWQFLSSKQKFYAIYVLTQPLFRHLSFLNMIFSPLLATFGFVPFWLVMLSFLPGYFLILQLGLYTLGLSELNALYLLKLSPLKYLTTILAFVPYQALLTIGTIRALTRHIVGNMTWDKTSHTNSHRKSLGILS